MSVSPQRLPVHPAPAPDEWMGSWLARLAHGNGLRPSIFLNMIGLNLGIPTLPIHVQTRLQEMTGFSPDEFVPMATPPDPLRRFVTEEFKHRDLLGVQKVQVCPHCLLEDPQPYIRRAWVRRSLTSCPRHGPLRDLCPHCKRYLHVIAAVPAQRRIYAPGAESIRTCWNCKADLTHPLAPVTPPLKPTPLRTLGGVGLDDAQYDRFRTALWTYLHDFRITLFIGPEAPEYYVMPRRTLHVTDETLETRADAERLTDWLLSSTADLRPGRLPPYSEHHRLRVVAQRILGLLLDLNETLNPRWLYIAWLATRLRDDRPSLLVRDWPHLALALAARLHNPPPPHLPWTLTDEQWDLVQPVWPEGEREAFQMLLDRAVSGDLTPQRAMSRAQWGAWLRTVARWKIDPGLGSALEALFLHLQPSPRAASPSRILMTAAPGTWQHGTAGLLTSDGVLELTRQVHPRLHRRLLLDTLTAEFAPPAPA